MNANQLQEIKGVLENLIVELQADIETAEESAKPVTLDQQAVGRVSRIDAIQQQQMQLAALERLKHRLQAARTALSRIDDADFGECKICEEPIEWPRLQARPEAASCLSCARNRE